MDNKLLLPGNGTGKIERAEESLMRKLLPKYLSLKLAEKNNTGNRIALMVSPTNGQGKYTLLDHLDHLRVGEDLKSLFGKNAKLFDSASSNDLKKVIQDESFAHIFVIGHSNYHSWLASDKSVDWFDLGQMVDGHLKNGLFVNLGCGALHSWNMLPLGYFIVSNHDYLLGHEAENVYYDKMGDLSRLKQLKRMPSLSSLVQ